MSEKNQLNESQIWTLVILVLPATILMNAGNELTNDSALRILYSGVFSLIGVTLGLIANYLTKNKSRSFKIIALLILITLSVLIIKILQK